jgi:hypothetical protein
MWVSSSLSAIVQSKWIPRTRIYSGPLWIPALLGFAVVSAGAAIAFPKSVQKWNYEGRSTSNALVYSRDIEVNGSLIHLTIKMQEAVPGSCAVEAMPMGSKCANRANANRPSAVVKQWQVDCQQWIERSLHQIAYDSSGNVVSIEPSPQSWKRLRPDSIGGAIAAKVCAIKA